MIDTILESCPWFPILKPAKGGRKHKILETIWGQVIFREPKVIVGLSLTNTYERICPKNAVIFPAILDTGFNRTLEIDERHVRTEELGVNKWITRLPFDTSINDEEFQQRESYAAPVHVWLHRSPYEYRGKRAGGNALLLGETKIMRIVVPPASIAEAPFWPPLPLLGLEALHANKLQVTINGIDKTYTISKLKV